MKFTSRTIKVWDIHAFCVFCGRRVVLSMVNDPEEVDGLEARLKIYPPVCEEHRALTGLVTDIENQPFWQTFEEYEEFVNASHK